MGANKYVYAGAAFWHAAGSGSSTAGIYRLDPATGKWDVLTKGLPDSVEVRHLAIAPDGAIYAGTQAGPCRSRDAGETWELLDLPGKDKVVWSILVHPKEPKTIFIGTENTTIYRSRDGGDSFQKLNVPQPESACIMNFPLRVIRLAADPNNADEIYAGLEVGGLVRSLDGGDTWEDCNPGLLKFAEIDRFKSRIGSDTDTEGMLDSHSLVVSPAKPGRLYLANRMGLFRSDDRGKAWEEMGIGKWSPLTYARDVTVSPHDPKVMFAALSVAAVSDEGSLYRSEDLGESWTRFDKNCEIESTLMAVAPSGSSPDRVYCAARRGQVFGTEDGGRSWQAYPLPDGVQGVYALATA